MKHSVRAAVGAVLVIWLALAVTEAAHAAKFDFSYSFPEYDLATFPSGVTSASGVITASDEGGGVFLVTDIFGTWNGEAITGILPPGHPGAINDNILLPGQYPVLTDTGGLEFFVSGPIAGDRGLGVVFVYYVPGAGYTDAGYNTDFSPTFNLTAAGVPEPATWATMIAGLIALGTAIRLRRKIAAATA